MAAVLPPSRRPPSMRTVGGFSAWLATPLGMGIALSVLLHLTVMLLKFAPPEPLRLRPFDAQIEVVLLNAQSPNRPQRPDVLAQVSQEGGGDRDKGRARSPLPADSRIEDGEDLVRQQQRKAELEDQQRQLMALARGPSAYVDPEKKPTDNHARTIGAEEQEVTAVIARMQAQIDKQIENYNKRPKRLTYGINAVGVSYARYVDDWAMKIERIGTDRYPPEARGKMYDELVITVEIDKHGNVVDVIINKRSKYDALNKVIKQIVYAGAPYEPFTPDMAKEGDILQIVRMWSFTRDALETSAARQR